MGNVGKELLNTLQKLGIQTVFYNRSPVAIEAKQVSVEQVFNQDIVFITIATNSDSIKLLSDIKSLIKETTYLIDVTGYDEQYDKQGVIELLNQGKMQGYAFETESEYESDKNFIATPHIAWRTKDAEKRTIDNLLNRALLILQGRDSEVDFIV